MIELWGGRKHDRRRCQRVRGAETRSIARWLATLRATTASPVRDARRQMRAAARDAALYRLRQKFGPLLPLEVTQSSHSRASYHIMAGFNSSPRSARIGADDLTARRQADFFRSIPRQAIDRKDVMTCDDSLGSSAC